MRRAGRSAGRAEQRPLFIARDSCHLDVLIDEGFELVVTGGLVFLATKLRAKGLLEKLPHSRRYRLAHKGYSICVLFLKLFERIYAPLTAGLLKPFSGDRNLAEDKRCQLDRLYQRLTDDLDALLSAVGLKTAA